MRRAGVLLPLFSLPGHFGIGDLGQDAYTFIDDIQETGASMWQILPLNPVGYGNSPYQTYSSFAGDEIYIDIEKLYKQLNLPLKWETHQTSTVNYTAVRKVKDELLRKAFKSFKKNDEYKSFIKETFWLEEYATFMALRYLNNYDSWVEWKEFTPNKDDVEYHKFLQYIFFKQWRELKSYANSKGIEIMGDLPIYLGHDSAEVYFHRRLFHLDDEGRPTLVAGVPPDFFNSLGQLWGNPIYNWDTLKTEGYLFWIERLRWNQEMFDIIRIDHFRAFDTYWAINGESNSAADGEWILGPAHDFFDEIYHKLPDINIVVEDLGDLRPEVLELRDHYSLMGMKIIQYSLASSQIKANKKIARNLLTYTGTHDNDTICGHLEQLSLKEKKRIKKDLTACGIEADNLVEQICLYALSLNNDWAILPIQDILGLEGRTRINYPGTVGSPNWEWKLREYNDTYYQGLKRFKENVKKTNRLINKNLKGGKKNG